MVHSLLAVSILVAAHAAPECGEAYAKDSSHDAAAIAACKACKGPNAVLIYDMGMLDNIGMTYCEAASLATPPDCGEAYAKDSSHDAAAIAACKACKGPNAHLIYDMGMLDNIGMTYCEAASLATPPDCGEAYAKDSSHDAAAIAACKACKGPNAHLIYDGGMLDNIGMTYCEAASLASPPDCGEAFAKDTSHNAEAIAACKSCKGENAFLEWDSSMADGIGYTYCYPNQRLTKKVSTPPDCGEAYARDSSHDADAIAACKACKGPNAHLVYDMGMLDNIGMTYCEAASLDTPPECGEAYAKDSSHDAAAIAACKACKGPNAHLVYDMGMLDNIGMTYCEGANTLDFSV